MKNDNTKGEVMPKTSCIMSPRRLLFMRLLVAAGRADYVGVNQPDLSYRAVVWRDKMYFV